MDRETGVGRPQVRASRKVATNGDSAIERGSMPSSRCSIVALPTTTAS
jgi:hypothetical protein